MYGVRPCAAFETFLLQLQAMQHYGQSLEVLFYEVLDMPLREYEQLKHMKVSTFAHTCSTCRIELSLIITAPSGMLHLSAACPASFLYPLISTHISLQLQHVACLVSVQHEAF